MSESEFQDLTGADDDSMDKLVRFVALLEKWNAHINLVAPRSLGDVWRRHLLDSAQIAPLAERTGRWLDIGSGAGFPGLVVAMMGHPDIHLVESDGRKATFLREAARITDTAVTIHNVRSENLAPQQAAVVSARAVAPLQRLLPLVSRHLAKNGVCLLLKGQDIDEELTLAAKSWRMTVEKIPSLSDPGGVIVKLTEVSDDRPGTAVHGEG
jgi:16S rRNA (guanine527-N7)-methyltransferase